MTRRDGDRVGQVPGGSQNREQGAEGQPPRCGRGARPGAAPRDAGTNSRPTHGSVAEIVGSAGDSALPGRAEWESTPADTYNLRHPTTCNVPQPLAAPLATAPAAVPVASRRYRPGQQRAPVPLAIKRVAPILFRSTCATLARLTHTSATRPSASMLPCPRSLTSTVMSLLGCVPAPRTKPADLVLLHGRVLTETPTGGYTYGAEAIAVRHERIVYVGSSAEARAYVGPETRVLDAEHKPVWPGLIDVHTHLGNMATFRTEQLDVRRPPLPDLDAVLAKIGQEAAKTPSRQWVQAIAGTGHDMPTRAQLDQVAPAIPVVVSESIHVQYLNSVALELSGIGTKPGPDPDDLPPGATIDRDEHGVPTGRIQEAARLWSRCIPAVTFEQRKRAVHAQLLEMASYGLTTIGDFPQPRDMKVYQDLLDEGRLPVRLRMNLFCSGRKAEESEPGHDKDDHTVPIVDTMDHFLLTGLGLRTNFGDDWLRLGALKLFLDGDGIAAMRYKEPYGDRKGWTGSPKVSADELNAFVAQAHAQGWQVLIHAVGDKGQDMCLEAFERAQKLHPRPDSRALRHRVEHMGNCEAGPTTVGMLQHARRIGVTPLVTPAWVSLDEFLPESEDKQPVSRGEIPSEARLLQRTLVDLGFPIPGNSDDEGSMQESWRPFFSIACQVLRLTSSGQTNSPEEAIPLDRAIQGWTRDSAWCELSENDKGRLAVGFLADFIILDRDPRSIDPKQLNDVQVNTTIVGGKVIFDREVTHLDSDFAFDDESLCSKGDKSSIC